VTQASALVANLESAGFRTVSGVPCSYFTGPIRLLERHPTIRYVAAANEGTALAVAAGARLAGEPSAVMIQNSGFGNLVNPLTSLVLPYRIPMLVIMSMRGWPMPEEGEPQHRWMGQVVPAWLDSLEVPHWVLWPDGPAFETLLAKAADVLATGGTAVILVGKGAIRDDAAPEHTAPDVSQPGRDDVIDALLAEIGDEYVVSTTGYLSRSLYNRSDRTRNFYMQGSMGHASGIALGAALVRPEERFVVLDGDGSALMHMGALATAGHYAPPNLVHVVFDNGAYESTGGQPSGSAGVHFDRIATEVGYRSTVRVGSVEQLRPAVRRAIDGPGPSMLVVDGRVGGAVGSRASGDLPVDRIASRFSHALTQDRNGAR
jgi:phosphonopyruvate decarboxylase